MSEYDRNVAARGFGAARATEIDVGLRAYMIRVYNYMAAGVALTGVASWLSYQASGGDAIHVAGGRISGLTAYGQAVVGGPRTIVLFIATIGLVFFLSARINRMQVSTAMGVFLLYAGLLGVMLTTVFIAYTGASITRTFFISAASFGALSLYGYTHEARSLADRLVPDDGRDRSVDRHACAAFATKPRPRLRHFGNRRADLRRPDRLGHAEHQGDV